jgi:hypothetical protein
MRRDATEVLNDLFERNEDLVFMKAYFDESGKHAQAEMITVSGLILRERECKILNCTWPKAMGDAPLPYHHTDFILGKEPFDFLSETEIDETQKRLIDAIKKQRFMAFGASVTRDSHAKFVKRIHPNPLYRDPWFFVFESAIREIMQRSAAVGITAPISFVFDRQDEFAQRAHQLFNELLTLTDLPYHHRLRTLSFAPKNDVCALQAIDLVVYEMNVFARETMTKKVAPPRWQMEYLRDGVSVDYFNGIVWDDKTLNMIAESKDEEVRALMEQAGSSAASHGPVV